MARLDPRALAFRTPDEPKQHQALFNDLKSGLLGHIKGVREAAGFRPSVSDK